MFLRDRKPSQTCMRLFNMLWETPYDSFVEMFGKVGKDFLDRLGIVKIPANEVTLDPILLGEKFKRHADKVILRKAGVIPTKKPESQK